MLNKFINLLGSFQKQKVYNVTYSKGIWVSDIVMHNLKGACSYTYRFAGPILRRKHILTQKSA